MAQSVVVAPKAVHVSKYGVTLGAIGALMITIEGIVAMIRNSLLVPTIGAVGLSVLLVGATEAVLGVIAISALYMSFDNPSGVADIVGVLAVLSLFVGGGFYFVGALVGLVGALLMHHRK